MLRTGSVIDTSCLKARSMSMPSRALSAAFGRLKVQTTTETEQMVRRDAVAAPFLLQWLFVRTSCRSGSGGAAFCRPLLVRSASSQAMYSPSAGHEHRRTECRIHPETSRCTQRGQTCLALTRMWTNAAAPGEPDRVPACAEPNSWPRPDVEPRRQWRGRSRA